MGGVEGLYGIQKFVVAFLMIIFFAPLKRQDFGIGVLKQFGTTWQLPSFFLSFSKITPPYSTYSTSIWQRSGISVCISGLFHRDIFIIIEVYQGHNNGHALLKNNNKFGTKAYNKYIIYI